MPSVPDQNVTEILHAVAEGGKEAADELFSLVYDMLRRLAHAKMADNQGGQTLQPTALVHEVYVRLIGGEDVAWKDRGHFFATAGLAMRQILVDHARSRASVKRGGKLRRLNLDEVDPTGELADDHLLALDEALDSLKQIDPDKAQIVTLRFFTGLTIDETAKALELSPATVKRHWHFARTWLLSEMTR